ncbi:MAG: hypothetical protein ACU83O_14205, partial [Gammaproteobacteria bacterium]
MGQEIFLTQFEEDDFRAFRLKLEQETFLLDRMIEKESLSKRSPVAGFEIEAWLVDNTMHPSPIVFHFQGDRFFCIHFE